MRRNVGDASTNANQAVQVAGQGFAGLAARDAPYATGFLAGSISAEDTTSDELKPQATVGTNTEYAAVHEYGSADGSIEPVGYFRNNLRDGNKLLIDELNKRML